MSRHRFVRNLDFDDYRDDDQDYFSDDEDENEEYHGDAAREEEHTGREEEHTGDSSHSHPAHTFSVEDFRIPVRLDAIPPQKLGPSSLGKDFCCTEAETQSNSIPSTTASNDTGKPEGGLLRIVNTTVFPANESEVDDDTLSLGGAPKTKSSAKTCIVPVPVYNPPLPEGVEPFLISVSASDDDIVISHQKEAFSKELNSASLPASAVSDSSQRSGPIVKKTGTAPLSSFFNKKRMSKNVAADQPRLKTSSPQINRFGVSASVKENPSATESVLRPASVDPSTDSMIVEYGIKEQQQPSCSVSTGAVVKQHSASRRKHLEEKIKENDQKVLKRKIDFVTIGHVDAGKSTLVGHMLYLNGEVSALRMHKLERESAKIGKSSFAFAWILDENSEERNRGVTMDIAYTALETDLSQMTIVDSPGHQDFVPNMISGVTQADVALLLVEASENGFDAGFQRNGQTREHILLCRSVGISRLIVVVNKMDVINYSKERYDSVLSTLAQFLKKTGFAEANTWYIPCSGLKGDNLICSSRNMPWYEGPSLLQLMERLEPSEKNWPVPFRLHISNVFKSNFGFAVFGKIRGGFFGVGDRLLLLPSSQMCTVKTIRRDGSVMDYAVAGESVEIALSGIDETTVRMGMIACDPQNPVSLVSSFRCHIITFSLELPIVLGQEIIVYSNETSEAGTIVKLVAELARNGKVKRRNPRCLGDNMSAEVEVAMDRPMCLELFSENKVLGRVTLREGVHTIAGGIVTCIL